jgi:hypothetical protein
MTDGPGSGGYHWRSEEHVAGWDAIRSWFDPRERPLMGDLTCPWGLERENRRRPILDS